VDPTIEEIKRRADIVDVVSQHVALRPAGGERFKACCPFHDEKTPSFYVSRDKGFYKCFGCGESGDVFKFLQKVENISFFEAKKQLAERYGVQLPKFGKELSPEQQQVYDERDRLHKIMAACAHFYREQFAGNKGLAARDYARTRGLSGKTLEKFGIGYAPDAWDALHHHLVNKYGFKIEDCVASGVLIEREDERGKRHYDRYRHRLMFPIWDYKGQCIAFGGRALEGGQTGNSDAKYINSPEGPLFNKSRILYAWHLARPEVGKRESIIITEGYMDTIALHEAGFSNTVATLGTALTAQHVAALARLSPKTVYLCFDGDSAGMRAALRSAPLFAAQNLTVRVVALPKEDDPDTFIRKHGEIGFQNALRNAKLFARYRLEQAIAPFDLSQVTERVEAIRAAAEVISEVGSDVEKDPYIAWLSDCWARAEGVTHPSRLQMMEAAVRREVGAASRRHKASTQYPPAVQREAENQEVNNTLSSDNTSKGVVQAERELLATLLNNPSSRSRLLEEFPPNEWITDIHREIAHALHQFDWNAPVDPAILIETLSIEAGQLVGELVIGDESQIAASPEVIQSWIQRIRGIKAEQIHQEMKELMNLKISRGEMPTREEYKAYEASLIATGRKVPVPKKD
jgi:DNA primase